MGREVRDAEGTVWSATQAFAGVGESAAARRAAERAASTGGHVAVVFTPSGGAQTVRGELPVGWEESASDDDLLAAIADGDRTPNGNDR
ncbi:MAG: hypothetical protein JWL60_1228 [Gemmatimonadetes bacterium]|jgi:hypothetical protein|nr:hypothetical protein [Gemmatimonadota bacterium]